MKVNCKKGDIFTTTEGYIATVIEYNGWYNVKVELNDGTILDKLILGSLKKGLVKNPMHRTSFDVGYFGQGNYSSVGINLQKYTIWKAMLQRCYDKKYQEKQPTYIGCSVAEEWHNFQNFAKWFDDNYIDGWHLDKDFTTPSNKTYSHETCCFLPRDINGLFGTSKVRRGNFPIGVRKKINKYQARINKGDIRINIGLFKTPEEAFQAYKIEKEKYIKEVANKYREQIPEKVYLNLINYQVEITD